MNNLSENLGTQIKRLESLLPGNKYRECRISLERLPVHKTSEEFAQFINWCEQNNLSPNHPNTWKMWGKEKKEVVTAGYDFVTY